MSGTLAGGSRLPSKRQLAANLRVSQITVESAYGQLLAEGYIASEPRRGYFVQRQLAVGGLHRDLADAQIRGQLALARQASAARERAGHDVRTHGAVELLV